MPRTAAHSNSVLIDQDFDSRHHTYTLTRTHQIDSRINNRVIRHVVRVRVARNSYADQSSATADVLTADLTWTQIVTAAPGDWWATTPLPGTVSRPPTADSLTAVTDALLARATAILAATTHARPATARPGATRRNGAGNDAA